MRCENVKPKADSNLRRQHQSYLSRIFLATLLKVQVASFLHSGGGPTHISCASDAHAFDCAK